MSVAERKVKTSLILLGILYASVLMAGFLAPYAPTEQNRDVPFAPPTRLHFTDAAGTLHWQPFVFRIVSDARSFGEYERRSQHDVSDTLSGTRSAVPHRRTVRVQRSPVRRRRACEGLSLRQRSVTDAISSRACCTAARSRSSPDCWPRASRWDWAWSRAGWLASTAAGSTRRSCESRNCFSRCPGCTCCLPSARSCRCTSIRPRPFFCSSSSSASSAGRVRRA